MRKNLKVSEIYYPDRSYKNSAGNGKIVSVLSSIKTTDLFIGVQTKRKSSFSKVKTKTKGKSYINALISTRRTKYGYFIVVTRQSNTTDEAYALAKKLQVELTEELLKHNRFKNDYDAFSEWFASKENILKDNGFHKLKD